MGLLSGLRILDFTIWRPGPYATQLLAAMGADVIKVEPPGGDPMRAYPGLFADLNAGKRGVVLDLKADEGRAAALRLAAEADVAAEGYRPGVARRLGIDVESVRSVNPGIVYCSLSGMGQTGPLASVPGHDLNYLAWAGALAPEGGPPRVPAIPVADLAGGMAAALGICAAVIRKATTGEGDYVDVAMGDVLASWTGAVRPEASGVDPAVRGVPGYGVFETADARHLVLGVLTEDRFWRPLCDVLELDGAGELAFTERVSRMSELQDRITAAVRGRERDAVVADLLSAGVPAAPVLDRTEMLDAPHFRERGVIKPETWADVTAGLPLQFERHPATGRPPPPGLDEHRGATFGSRP